MVDSTVSSLLRVRCTRMRGISAPQDSERAGLARWSRLSWWWSSPGTARLARAGTVYTDRVTRRHSCHTTAGIHMARSNLFPSIVFDGVLGVSVPERTRARSCRSSCNICLTIEVRQPGSFFQASRNNK